MTPQEISNWYYNGEGQAFHDELGSIFGLKSFLAGNTGPQAGGWFSKEIAGPEDFQGLKFRMPGLGGQALGKMGAEITKFYYTAGMHEPGAALSLATNLDVFESLSPAHQKVIETASGEAHGCVFWLDPAFRRCVPRPA